MRVIELQDEHRRRHFEFFSRMNHPHFNICANVEVHAWLETARAQGLRTTPAIVFLLTKVANAIPELRRRLREGVIVEHEIVHPSFSVQTQASEAFSFCEVEFTPDPREFIARAEQRMREMNAMPSFDNDPGRDDYLFMSPIPWVSFTALQHAMMYHPHDSVPRITWGKFISTPTGTSMPLSLQVHHAVVDGAQVGLFFQRVEELAARPELLGGPR